MTAAGKHDWRGAVARARANAPFLARALERRPDLAELLEDGRGEDALALAGAVDPSLPIGVALRRERLARALVLAVGDLAGAFPLLRVTGELSAFADTALDRAIADAIGRRVEGAGSDGFYALALGKHGAGELNYSSDIDPIMLYDPDRMARRKRDEPGEAAQRYAREIVRLLGENTAEGYVFRVDLRLRPASEVSPLAISEGAALTHYESSALAWERAAFIRARASAGDVAAARGFLETIRPFVWRRSLDFGAIDEIHALVRRIRDASGAAERVGPGYDLKKGRGGIREIEFFAQAHQLIHGGRDPALRVRGTRAALDALAAARHIEAEAANELGDAYDRLRTVEHRVQMLEDRQTHAIPSGDALERVAALDGKGDGAALLAEMDGVTSRVAARFDALVAEGEPEPKVHFPGLPEDDARALAQRIERWRDGRYRALRSEAALRAFDAMLPAFLEALGASGDPERVLLRWETLLERCPSALNLFRLLEARPALLALTMDVLALAGPLADELARRPELLDALIDRRAFALPGPVGELAQAMRAGERGDAYEQLLDRIRIVTGETRFALGVQLIEGAQDPLAIAEGLARVAEAALRVAVEGAAEEFAGMHGRIADGELVVLGLGRFGGGALTHASDLDIVYLFTGGLERESDGERPLGATRYFNRLAQRVSAALSVPTAQGALYEVDTRLRPQGAQGPLAASVESFAKYQRENAWTWEHMALTRARVLVGSDAARARIEGIVGEVLRAPRDAAQLRADVLAMRNEMATHKPPRGPLDAKLLRGGLVDCEFLVHFLQLRGGAALEPAVDEALRALIAAGTLEEDIVEAHAFMTRLLVSARLLAPDLAMPPNLPAAALARACRLDSAGELVPRLAGARRVVAQAWARQFGEQLEID